MNNIPMKYLDDAANKLEDTWGMLQNYYKPFSSSGISTKAIIGDKLPQIGELDKEPALRVKDLSKEDPSVIKATLWGESTQDPAMMKAILASIETRSKAKSKTLTEIVKTPKQFDALNSSQFKRFQELEKNPGIATPEEKQKLASLNQVWSDFTSGVMPEDSRFTHFYNSKTSNPVWGKPKGTPGTVDIGDVRFLKTAF